QAARELCDRYGALLIFDEVQCGLCRTGSLFAYQNYGVSPDIITLAKGIANGLPLGIMLANEKAASGFAAGDHGSTFGANPVACSAAIATLSILISENYSQRVQVLGDYFLKKLKSLHGKYSDKIAAVRGKGLMLALELKSHASEVMQACQENGLL